MYKTKSISVKDFIDLFDTDKITGIYVDTAEDEIKTKIWDNKKDLNDILKDYPNILTDINYLKISGSGYVIDKDAIFSEFKDYKISYCIPRISEENKDFILEELDKINDDNEYTRKLSEYSIGCNIIIKPNLKITDIVDFWPKVNNGFNGYVLLDIDPDDFENGDVPYRQTLICVLPDDTDLRKVLAQRVNYITSVYKMDDGNPDVNNSKIYYTDDTGFVQCIGTFDIQQTDEDVDEVLYND